MCLLPHRAPKAPPPASAQGRPRPSARPRLQGGSAEAGRPWASARAPQERTEGPAWPGAAPSHANTHSPKDADATRDGCHEAMRTHRAARAAAERGLSPRPPARVSPPGRRCATRAAGQGRAGLRVPSERAVTDPPPLSRGLRLRLPTPPALPSPRTAGRAPASTHPSPPRTLFTGYVKPREECLSKHRFLSKHVNNCRIWFEGMFYYNGC